MIKLEPNSYELTIAKNRITSVTDLQTGKVIPKFSFPVTSSQYKIYILTNNKLVLYIGTSKTSIKSRLNSGLTASGQHGYHGYKWKNYKKVKLFVWCFDQFDKDKIENIEAELAFIIRKTTGKWPACQNEIHFNNLFHPTGGLVAEKIHRQLKGLNLIGTVAV